MKTPELLELAKKKLKTEKDSELAKALGTTRGGITHYRNGNRAPDELVCFKLAEILELDPQAVIATIRAEAEKDEEKRKYWKLMSLRYSVALSVLIMSNIAVLNSAEPILHTLNY